MTLPEKFFLILSYSFSQSKAEFAVLSKTAVEVPRLLKKTGILLDLMTLPSKAVFLLRFFDFVLRNSCERFWCWIVRLHSFIVVELIWRGVAPPSLPTKGTTSPFESPERPCGVENPRSKERMTLGFVHPARKLLITMPLAHFCGFRFRSANF